MNNIFDIRFSFEQKVKDEVIYKFSNKQGGAYNVFAYHWQCFAWAAVIGFLKEEPRPLTPPIADKPFSLKTMMNNDGEKVAHALICMCIAKANSLDIMKEPESAIKMINEYANAGFYHILKLMENGQNSFNDIEKVKQEIFTREMCPNSADTMQISEEDLEEEQDDINDSSNSIDFSTIDETPWPKDEIERLTLFFQHGMEIPRMAEKFNKSIGTIHYQLDRLGFIEMPLSVKVEKSEEGYNLVNYNDKVVYSDDTYLKIFNNKVYRFNIKPMCLTVKDIKRGENGWEKGSKKLVAYTESKLFSALSSKTFYEDVEDFVEGEVKEKNQIKYKGIWYDYYGDIVK